MSKKLAITVEDDVYTGLRNVIGRRRISRSLNDLARPHVTGRDLGGGYRAVAADEEREREAMEWAWKISPATLRMNPDRTPRPFGPAASRNDA